MLRWINYGYDGSISDKMDQIELGIIYMYIIEVYLQHN